MGVLLERRSYQRRCGLEKGGGEISHEREKKILAGERLEEGILERTTVAMVTL